MSLVNTLYAPFGVGGAGRSVKELAESLVLSGHEVQVNTLAPRGATPMEELIRGVHVRRYGSQSFRPFDRTSAKHGRVSKATWHLSENRRAGAQAFLTNSFATFNPDVVHSNNIAGFGLAAWKAAWDFPLIHTLRDYYLVCARSQLYRDGSICATQCASCSFLKGPIRRAGRVPDLFVGVSEDIVSGHRELGLIPSDVATAVVYNSPQLPPQRSEERAERRALVRFGLLGRVGSDKGTWKAIEAFQRLPAAVLNASELLIAGSTSLADENRLREIVRQQPGLRYLGQDVSATTFFDQIDIALVPSQWREPFGRVAAEARLAGKRVIASGVGGLPEALDQFGGGRVVKRFNDVDSWSAAMGEEFQRAGRPMAAFNRPARSVLDQYLGLYNQLRR